MLLTFFFRFKTRNSKQISQPRVETFATKICFTVAGKIFNFKGIQSPSISPKTLFYEVWANIDKQFGATFSSFGCHFVALSSIFPMTKKNKCFHFLCVFGLHGFVYTSISHADRITFFVPNFSLLIFVLTFWNTQSRQTPNLFGSLSFSPAITILNDSLGQIKIEPFLPLLIFLYSLSHHNHPVKS